jgi:peptide/nickel transport system substrate-binding protein
VPGEHLYLTRNDDYWGGPPNLDRVEIVGIPDATAAFTALTTGTWDAMWNLSTKDASQLSSSPSAVPLVPKVQSSNVFWELDTTSPPFDKVEARQALSYAVDRKSIAEVAYFGFAQPYYFNDPVPPDNWAFTEGMTDYQYDLEKAKELFEAAGVTEGTELTFWTIASQFPEWITAAEILQQSLAEIGITLKIEQNEVGTWVDKFYPSGKKYPGLIIPNGDTALLDPAFRLKFFSVDRCECNYNDPKIDELLAEGKSTGDQAKRKEAYDEIQRIVNEQVPVIIPTSWPFLNANQDYVKDIWAESGGFIHYEDAWLDE